MTMNQAGCAFWCFSSSFFIIMSEFGGNNPGSRRINETEMQQMFFNFTFISNNSNSNNRYSERMPQSRSRRLKGFAGSSLATIQSTRRSLDGFN